MKKLFIKYKNKIKNRDKRKIIRSYNLLLNQNKIKILSKINEEISKTKLEIPSYLFSKYIFGSALLEGEIALRQQLISSIIYLKLNKKILLYYSENKKLVFPIPKQWLQIIESHGIKVSYYWSSVFFKIYIIKSYINGLKSVLSNLLDLIFFSREINGDKYVQFMDLMPSNLPIDNCDIESKNIINWYIINRIHTNQAKIIKHNVDGVSAININGIKIISNTNFLPPLLFRSFVKYFFSIIYTSIYSFIDLLRGRWWHPFLLSQSLLSKRIKYASCEKLAEEYLFSNSNWLNRPLWTYEASALGSKVTLYFYSTNCEYFKDKSNKSIIVVGYNAMNWPNYLVWDAYQAFFIKNLNDHISNINIVGPIWFQSSKATKELVKNRSIAIFDVSPYRDSIYSTIGIPDTYYRSNNNIKFINDIIEIALKYKYYIRIKQKRELRNSHELKYINFLKNLKLNSNIEFIEPNISAIDVIDSSKLVVSMPFTSTSIIANEYGYKSAYYDPTGQLLKNDPAAHGVILLSNKIELENWILNN
jgi:polysaccharide biosynthesis PFTS motif protein